MKLIFTTNTVDASYIEIERCLIIINKIIYFLNSDNRFNHSCSIRFYLINSDNNFKKDQNQINISIAKCSEFMNILSFCTFESIFLSNRSQALNITVIILKI